MEKKIVKYLIIESGVVRAQGEEKPDKQKYIFGENTSVYKFHEQEYEAALSRWKEESIPVANPEMLKETVWKYGDIVKDGIYPAPVGLVMEVKECCASDSCTDEGQCEHCREPKKTAALSFTEPSKEQSHSGMY